MHKGMLKINLPNMPKGAEVEVFPYGMFENGKGYEVENLCNAEGEEVDELVLGDLNAQLPDPIPEPTDETDQEPPPVRTEDTGAEATTNDGGDE
jgi:hypothetical protein